MSDAAHEKPSPKPVELVQRLVDDLGWVPPADAINTLRFMRDRIEHALLVLDAQAWVLEERDACARMLESKADQMAADTQSPLAQTMARIFRDEAAAIRARGKS